MRPWGRGRQPQRGFGEVTPFKLNSCGVSPRTRQEQISPLRLRSLRSNGRFLSFSVFFSFSFSALYLLARPRKLRDKAVLQGAKRMVGFLGYSRKRAAKPQARGFLILFYACTMPKSMLLTKYLVGDHTEKGHILAWLWHIKTVSICCVVKYLLSTRYRSAHNRHYAAFVITF